MPTIGIVRAATDEFGRVYDGGEPDILIRLLCAHRQARERSRPDPNAPTNHARHTLNDELALLPSASLP